MARCFPEVRLDDGYDLAGIRHPADEKDLFRMQEVKAILRGESAPTITSQRGREKLTSPHPSPRSSTYV